MAVAFFAGEVLVPSHLAGHPVLPDRRDLDPFTLELQRGSHLGAAGLRRVHLVCGSSVPSFGHWKEGERHQSLGTILVEAAAVGLVQ